MQKLRRLSAVLLAWAMLFGMSFIPAGAAENGYQLSILSVQTFPAETTPYDASAASAASARQNEIVVVNVGLRNETASTVDIGAFGSKLQYDAEKLEVYRFFNGESYQAGGDFSTNWTVLGNAQGNYVNVAGFAMGNAALLAPGASTIIARLAFKVKANAADGSAQFKFDAADCYVSDQDSKELKPLGLAAQSLTISKSASDSGDSSTPAPAVTPGDVDGDGDVTAIDARIALQMATSVIAEEDQTATQKTAADVDKDGKVTAMDARRILQFASGVLQDL